MGRATKTTQAEATRNFEAKMAELRKDREAARLARNRLPDEYRETTVDGIPYKVHAYLIATTTTRIYNAWERTRLAETGQGGHSTVTTIGGTWYGQVGHARLPEPLDALPVDTAEQLDARIEAVEAWHALEARRAHRAIQAAFPEAAHGTPDGAEIRMDASEL